MSIRDTLKDVVENVEGALAAMIMAYAGIPIDKDAGRCVALCSTTYQGDGVFLRGHGDAQRFSDLGSAGAARPGDHGR